MKVLINSDEVIKGATALAIGNFDGLHLGHQYLINTMLTKAKERSLKSSVFTFYNHTASVLKNRTLPKILMNQNQRIEAIKRMDVEILYMMNFDENIMRLAPREFVEKILIDKLNIKLVVVGFNFRFGFKAKGDVEYLKKLGKELGFEVEVIDPIYKDEEIVSSSYIRELVEEGNIEKANFLLGKPYATQGTVVQGKGRGKGLGYPTANITLSSDYVIPKLGVYKTTTLLKGKSYNSVTNVGKNPTFDEEDLSVETYILDLDEDIYGELIEVSFLNFIRGEVKFKSKEELINQMALDVECTRTKC